MCVSIISSLACGFVCHLTYCSFLSHWMVLIPAGFLVQKESIDADEQNDPNEKYVPSQTINIYTKGWQEPGVPTPETGHVVKVDDEAIWTLLQPWIPKITQIVKDGRNKEDFGRFYPDEPEREPELNWVRGYLCLYSHSILYQQNSKLT